MNRRLALLDSIERGIPETEVFRLALLHGVAELGGLGGAVHLRGPTSVLRLVATTGLPPAVAQSWEIIDQEGAQAQARAVRLGRRVWAPYTSAMADPLTGAGLAAVPIPGVDRVNGVLTILTPGREPTPEQWDFLSALTAWSQSWAASAPPPAGRPREDPLTHAHRDLRALQVGTWDWNIRTGELFWDDAAMMVYGADPDTFVPRVESWMKIVHPDDLPSILTAVDKAIRDATMFEAEYRVLRPDGSQVWTQARARLVLDAEGGPYRLIGRAWESNESPAARNTLSRVLRHMSDSFLALDHDGKIVFSNLPAERILGYGGEDLVGRVLWDLPPVRHLPEMRERCRTAAVEGRPTELDVEGASGGSFHLRIVPVPDGITVYGTDVTARRKAEAARAAARREAAERAKRTADLTAALATATTSEDVVDAVAERILGAFVGSSLLVYTVENGRAYVLGARGVEKSVLDLVDGRVLEQGDPVSEVIATGEPVFVDSQPQHQARYPHLAEITKASGMNAAIYLPLTASGHTFGVCLIAFDDPHTTLSSEDSTLATAYSALVAHALERARLHDAEHRRSHELQSSLLPKALPQTPECTTAARYLSAGRDMEVGGDWYDVIPLSGCRVAFVIGDVVGHGLAEAATMGRLRTAVRTLAGFELPPDEIMSHLNDTIGELGPDSYATCLYALYDSTDGRCSIVSAGHPPPAIVHPDGSVRFLDHTPDPPLGAAEPPFSTAELLMPEESLLVLYTDGLVESSQRPLDEGMSELKRLLSTARRTDLDRLCDRIVADLLPPEQPTADDSALLIAQVHALPADRIASWTLPDEPQAAGQARGHVRRQLGEWGLDELSSTTELLVSELVGNVVRYATGPIGLRMLHGEDLICEVSDGSLTMPRIRQASETDEGGRGLQLVAALSEKWGTRYTKSGKWIWTAQPLSDTEVPEAPRVPFDPDTIAPL